MNDSQINRYEARECQRLVKMKCK